MKKIKIVRKETTTLCKLFNGIDIEILLDKERNIYMKAINGSLYIVQSPLQKRGEGFSIEEAYLNMTGEKEIPNRLT